MAAEPTPEGDPAVEPPDPEDELFLNSLPVRHRERAKAWRTSIKQGAQAKFDQAAEARRGLEEIDQALAPFAPALQQGITRAQLVASAVATLNRMGSDPAGTLETLAQNARNSGVVGPEQAEAIVRRIAAALGVQAGTRQGQAVDEASRRIAALEAKLAAQDRAQQMAAQQQMQAIASSAEAKIKAFAEEKGPDGKPLRPHFNAVKGTIGALMQAEGLDLETAYARAIWSRDDLRESLIQQRQAEAAKATAATSRQAVARARQAATPRTISVPVRPDASTPKSTGALLEELYDEVVAGASH